MPKSTTSDGNSGENRRGNAFSGTAISTVFLLSLPVYSLRYPFSLLSLLHGRACPDPDVLFASGDTVGGPGGHAPLHSQGQVHRQKYHICTMKLQPYSNIRSQGGIVTT